MHAVGTNFPIPKPFLYFPQTQGPIVKCIFEILKRHTANPLEDAEVSNTTPTRSTYCIQKSRRCLCLGNVGADFTHLTGPVKKTEYYFFPQLGEKFLLKHSQLRQPQSEALMKTRIISVSI